MIDLSPPAVPFSSSTAIRRIAVMGNPNSGKTTIFNALTGLHHKVANYPGVTVERREAKLTLSEGASISLVDLPGTYSLVPRGADEHIARDVLLGLLSDVRPVDAVLIIVDASNLERHLYLATQIIELGFPAVVCCNMSDAVEATGQQVDFNKLADRLGVPTVATVGNRGLGIAQLKQALAGLCSARVGSGAPPTLPPAMEDAARGLAERVRELGLGRKGFETQFALLMLAGGGQDEGEVDGRLIPEPLLAAVDQALVALKDAGIVEPHTLIVHARLRYVRELAAQVVTRRIPRSLFRSDRVDRVVTHPVGGLLIFAALAFVIFLAIFSWAEPLMNGIESVLGGLGTLIAGLMPEGILQSLLVDGVVAGVGAVVVFLPQICMLFFFICLLEDTGYMARAALLMNRLMTRVGLPGKSFIPLLSSFACAIPGIMAARTIENRRDRLVTILIAPFMSCSARLPVYIVLIGALFAGSIWLQAGIMLSMYLLGIVVALLVAFVLKRTILKGPQAGLLIELPPYRRPRLRVILRSMWERSVLFLKDAGTIIFAVSILLWALAYFPRSDADAAAADPGLQLRQSVMGHIGLFIEPAIEPLGFDWKIGIGLTASFAAREVFVSTMGIVYGVGDDANERSEPLRARIAADAWPDGRKVFTPLTGISLMVFYVLACQCVSTLGVVKRETNSWRWPAFMFAYMTVLAYVGSLLVYQVGSAMGL